MSACLSGKCGCTGTSKRKPAKKQLRNNVALVLDDSGSMNSIASAAQTAFNKIVTDTQKKAAETGQITNVSLIYFGKDVEVKYAHRPVKEIKPISSYNPHQSYTSLFSGILQAVDTLDEVATLKKYDDAYLIMTVTDGEENNSGTAAISRAVTLFKEKQEEGNWTFVFMLPPGYRNHFCSRYGIPTDNVMEWKQTEAGVTHMSEVTGASIGGYYASRSLGHKSVANFFVQPNLAAVRPTEIKRTLDDVAPYCKQFTVPKEEVIKDFVEKKTKAPYVVGTAYYQLMKPEKVQSGKGVLLVEKGKPQVWAGVKARSIIGLPTGADAKVEPGNHANYDIFIQSRSVNRKLPRGTKIIVYDN